MERETKLTHIFVDGKEARVGDAILVNGYWWGITYLSLYMGVVSVWAEDEDGEEYEFAVEEIESVVCTFKV